MRGLFKTIATGLLSPVAIGIYLTMLTVGMTIPYYDLATSVRERDDAPGFSELMYTLHQKSIDYRLRLRGPRPVDPELALITVDERAIATLGRWPWPREQLARGIERLMRDRAKLLAFDISFAEPSQNPAALVLENLHRQNQHQLDSALSPQLARFDQDEALRGAFKTYGPKLVAGNFFVNTLANASQWPPDTEFCRELIFKHTAAARAWEREDAPLSTLDPFQAYMPRKLLRRFEDLLDEAELQLRSVSGKPQSRGDEALFEQRVRDQLHEKCDTILDDYAEPIAAIWKSQILAQENPREFRYSTYAEWRAAYRERLVPNAVETTDSWMMNTPAIAGVTHHTGFFNTEQDSDGTIRRKLLTVRSGEHYFPSLALKTFLVAKNYRATVRLGWNAATRAKEIAEFEVTDAQSGESVFNLPVDGHGRQLLNFAGPQKMFPYLSFADVLSDSPWATVEQRVFDQASRRWAVQSRRVKKADFIRDKILLLGVTAHAVYDLRVTPFEENYPGAETHLTAIENMLRQNFFSAPRNERLVMALGLMGMGTLLSLALALIGAVSGLMITLTTLISIILADHRLLFSRGTVVAVIWPLSLTALLYVVLTFYRYVTEARGKRELRRTFSKYVSPAIVNEILAHPDNLDLGGRRAHLTVFFSDVRGFTTIAEKLDPRALAELLNSYLTPMTELVFRHQGTLDKYMGDGVMAFFGAPLADPAHAEHACRCALESLATLKTLQSEYAQRGLPAIDIGIGLNTGEVNVGNMGSESVRSYTVLGDAVNLASRLEGINREYGTRIIISEMTYREVHTKFLCRELDLVRVKGKTQPVKIFELLADVDAPEPVALKAYREGFRLYHARRFADAARAFAEVLAQDPADGVAKLYLSRCQNYQNHPPESDWDGVFDMKTK